MQVRHGQLNRILFDLEKCSGKACIRDSRMSASSILAYLSSGMTAKQILEEWPELVPEDLSQALAYAAAVLEGGELGLEDPRDRIAAHSARRLPETTLGHLVGCAGYRGPAKILGELETAIARGARERR